MVTPVLAAGCACRCPELVFTEDPWGSTEGPASSMTLFKATEKASLWCQGGVEGHWGFLSLCTHNHLEACMIADSFTDREIEAGRGLRSLTRAPWLMSGRVRI